MHIKGHNSWTKSFGREISAGWHPRAVPMPIADVLAGKNCLIDQKFPLCRDLRPSSPITKKEAVHIKGHVYAATQTA